MRIFTFLFIIQLLLLASSFSSAQPAASPTAVVPAYEAGVTPSAQTIPGFLLESPGAPLINKAEAPRRWRSLSKRLEEILAYSYIDRKEIGVFVVALPSGEPVFSLNAEKGFNPASNMKVLTSSAALTMLGPGYHFRTEIHLTAPPEQGVVGDIYVKGFGDPTIVSERLWYLAAALKDQGVREVKGEIILDTGFFSGALQNPGWVREQDGAQAYQAPYDAVALNFNAVRVTILPGYAAGEKARILLEPDSSYFKVQNEVRTIDSGRTTLNVDQKTERGQMSLTFRGAINIQHPGEAIYRKVEHPALYFGHTLRAYLKLAGMKVAERYVKIGKVPYQASLFYTLYSPTLSEILWDLNKRSNNIIAEQLLKTLGAELFGPPGDWTKGLKAIEYFLDFLGIPPDSYTIVNGSGLADTTKISPFMLVRIMHYMSLREELFPEFASSLSVSGADGTLRNRFKEVSIGKIRGKTGSIDNVNTLSGYAVAKNREMFAFCVMINNEWSYSAQAAVIDALATVLTDTAPDE
jgi:D-alanyl-D-alanine carboxypeptidase/D-alanyl-D-alanine-endopeptidase (penicillin-binding protein 4)